jgi:hypothetical protein
MASMPAPAASRAVPAGALFALAIGLLLYLTTSLVLGTPGSRVLDVSLSLPRVEAAPEAPPNPFSGDPVKGSRVTPVLAASLVAVVSHQVAPAAPTATPSSASVRKAPGQPATSSSVRSRPSHYHDADERSRRLARRR